MLDINRINHLCKETDIAEEGMVIDFVKSIIDKIYGITNNLLNVSKGLIGIGQSELVSYWNNHKLRTNAILKGDFTTYANTKIPLPSFKDSHINTCEFIDSCYKTINIKTNMARFHESLKDIFKYTLMNDNNKVMSVNKELRRNVQFKDIKEITKIIDLQYTQPYAGEIEFGTLFNSMKQFRQVVFDLLSNNKTSWIYLVNHVHKRCNKLYKLSDNFVFDLEKPKKDKSLKSNLKIVSDVLFDIGNVIEVYGQVVKVHNSLDHNVTNIIRSLRS
jgi:hypothetical protein